MQRRSVLSSQGFTLVELMIVVVIVAILAATAIPSFQRQMLRARAAEAPSILGQIRMRQESYRSEFGQYAGPTALGTLFPASAPNVTPVTWIAASAPEELRMLGVNPDGPVRFGYRVAAGYGTAPAAQYPAGYDDWWYVAQAHGDLDGDGTSYFVEAIAGRGPLYVSTTVGYE